MFSLSRDQGGISISPLAPLTILLPLLNECSVAARLFYHTLSYKKHSLLFQGSDNLFRYRTESVKISAVIFAIDYGCRKTNVGGCKNTGRQFLFLVRFFFAAKEKNEHIKIETYISLSRNQGKLRMQNAKLLWHTARNPYHCHSERSADARSEESLWNGFL